MDAVASVFLGNQDHVQEVCPAILHLLRQAKDPGGVATRWERGRLHPVAADLLRHRPIVYVVLKPGFHVYEFHLFLLYFLVHWSVMGCSGASTSTSSARSTPGPPLSSSTAVRRRRPRAVRPHQHPRGEPPHQSLPFPVSISSCTCRISGEDLRPPLQPAQAPDRSCFFLAPAPCCTQAHHTLASSRSHTHHCSTRTRLTHAGASSRFGSSPAWCFRRRSLP